MISIERNRDPEYDPNLPPTEIGLRIDDHTVLGLIGEVLELKGERSSIEEAAEALTKLFWDDELWIVTYGVGQGYGGPEEGGWYFPVYSVDTKRRVMFSDWASGIPLAKSMLAAVKEECKKLEWGQYGSFGGWNLYEVQLELAPQGWDDSNGPGKKERVFRPVYC